MRVYVAFKWWWGGDTGSTCLGVYRSKDDAIEAIESDETWNDDFRVPGEDFWGNEEFSATIEEHEVE